MIKSHSSLVRHCTHCGQPAPNPFSWQCSCHGPFEYQWSPAFNPRFIRNSTWSQARYQEMLLPPNIPLISLGEGMTPITQRVWDGQPISFKLDYLNPTGSYKDRGSSTLISILAAEGYTHLVEDSSGNAGASMAAYATAAGLTLTVFVPSYTSASKQAQIATFGATLTQVEGPRYKATEACNQAAQQSMYASHIWHPAFLLGQICAAWELWEQTAPQLPEVIMMPVGQGNMLLGYYRGFRALIDANLISHMPRLVAVQAQACAPIARAWELGLDKIEAVIEQPTVAAGIRTQLPVHGNELLQALHTSQGFALAVDDAAIQLAQQKLARHGLFVEATSAVPVAAINQVRQRLGAATTILIPLSGSGLKEM